MIDTTRFNWIFVDKLILTHPVAPTKGNPASPPMLKALPRSAAYTPSSITPL